MTPPEARLWQVLKGRQLAGLKFRRQHPIGPYVLDFCCPEAKLAVEVDGMGHFEPEQSLNDRQRDDWLQRQGLTVLRIAAEDVRTNLDGVAVQILEWAKAVCLTEEPLRPAASHPATSPLLRNREETASSRNVTRAHGLLRLRPRHRGCGALVRTGAVRRGRAR